MPMIIQIDDVADDDVDDDDDDDVDDVDDGWKWYVFTAFPDFRSGRV